MNIIFSNIFITMTMSLANLWKFFHQGTSTKHSSQEGFLQRLCQLSSTSGITQCGDLRRTYWSLSLVTQSHDVYILPSRFVCLPHLFNYTCPRIPKGYEPRAVPLIICVILRLSAPVRSFGRDHSVSFCVFCVFLRLFEIIDREQFISPYPPSPKHHPAGFPLSFSPYLHHIKLIT